MSKLKSNFQNVLHIGVYYGYKLYHRVMSELLCSQLEGTRGAGLRYVFLRQKKEKINFSGEIIFGFWDSSLVHLGDMLFHLPLALALKARGYKVTVLGGGSLASYFEASGVAAVPLSEWLSKPNPGSLLVSKNDVLWSTYRKITQPVYFLGLDYNWLEDDEPVSLAIIHAVGKALELLEENGHGGNLIAASRFPPPMPEQILKSIESKEWWKVISEARETKWVLFNPYVASNQLMTLGKTQGLVSLAKRKKEEGFKIIFTGSQKDKKMDGQVYEFVDLDLRGKLSPADLIALAAHPEVQASISYDTFAMHAASLSRKDLYVAVKDSLRVEKFKKRFVPMYPGADDSVRVCE